MSNLSPYQQDQNRKRVEAAFLKLNQLDGYQVTKAMAELMGRLEVLSQNQFGMLSDETLSVVIGALESSLQNQVRTADISPLRQFVDL